MHSSERVSFVDMKKKDFPDPLDIEVTGQAGPVASISEKNKIFVFMVLKAQVLTCELCGHKKKKEKISATPSKSKSQVWTCGVNFGKI